MVPALLRDRVFRRYWSASTISMFGDQISGVALPLAAVLALHVGAAQMGYLTALEWLPSLLFGLPAGAWVDRRGRRRRTMIAADLGRAALFASIPVGYALHALTLAQLFAVTFAAGTLSILFNVSDGTLFVSIVAPDQYMDGQSLIYGSRALSFVGGPSIGGLLVQALSAPFAVAADALSFLGSAFFLSRIRPAEPPADDARGSVTGRHAVHRRLGAGPRVADLGGHGQLLQPHVRRAVPAVRGAGAAHQAWRWWACCSAWRPSAACSARWSPSGSRRGSGSAGPTRPAACCSPRRWCCGRWRTAAMSLILAMLFTAEFVLRVRGDDAGHQHRDDLRRGNPGHAAVPGDRRVPGGQLRHPAARGAARRAARALYLGCGPRCGWRPSAAWPGSCCCCPRRCRATGYPRWTVRPDLTRRP